MCRGRTVGRSDGREAQRALCEDVARALGFDFGRGRIDVSAHPFTGGAHTSDVRITTRYSPTNCSRRVEA